MTIKQVVKQLGVGKTLLYILYRIAQRGCTLDVTHIKVLDAVTATDVPMDPALEFRQLSADEVVQFSTDPANDLDAKLAFRLDLGRDLCLAALDDGKLASYCWIALDSIETKHNRSSEDMRSGIAMSFPSDYAFRYKGFTHPGFRGRRIYQQLSAFAARELLVKHGVRYQISTAEWVNFSALRATYHSGYAYQGLGVVFGWGDHLWRRGPRNLEKRGIFLGHRANVLCRDRMSMDAACVPPMEAGVTGKALELTH